MKKHILTLTMCLALTVSSAFASCPCSGPCPANTTPVKKHVVVAKKHVTVAKRHVALAKKHVAVAKNVVPVAQKQVPCACPTAAPATMTLTPAEIARKNFEERMIKERENFYSALCLTPEQRAKAEALDLQNRTAVEPLIAKVHQERAKLRELKAKKACPIEIAKQKHEAKLARKAVKEQFAAADKEFRAILTQDQVAKLETIRKERRAEMKKHHPCGCPMCKHHRHHCKPECQKSQAPGNCPCACHKHHLFGQHKCPWCLAKEGKKPCACPECKKHEAAPAPCPDKK